MEHSQPPLLAPGLSKQPFHNNEDTDLPGECRAYEITLYHDPNLKEENKSQENMNFMLRRREAQKQAECLCHQRLLRLRLACPKPEITPLVTASPVSRLPPATANVVRWGMS